MSMAALIFCLFSLCFYRRNVHYGSTEREKEHECAMLVFEHYRMNMHLDNKTVQQTQYV